MAITLTAAAAERVTSFIDQRGNGIGLRVGIRKTGCSGFAYVVDYADEVGPDDVVFQSRGVKVVIDPKALGVIDGTEVDFVVSGLNQAFAFRNPNVTGECGCGESFSVAPEPA